ncbi:hypothetical protein LSH36_510g00003 [Paralvinella palmiformis]|uniref:YqaJ viral recombinase domain-containing protein n=1 Tax=Paralvinella palmiformis TaxID=53620 RepID=A0AAD9MWM7_9ANNE|nr:hypothetical protein LSH36_510g00003 [Paralvinella palmiformis]
MVTDKISEKEKKQRHKEANKKSPKAAAAAVASGVDVPKRRPEKKRKRTKKSKSKDKGVDGTECPIKKPKATTVQQVPDITVDKVMVYLALFGQEVRKNAKEMYFAKFLQSIRIMIRSSMVRKYEAIARSAYVELTGNVVVESGIMVCADSPYLGCSLDGLIGEDGIIEIKYPFTSCDKDITPETVPYQMLDDHTGKLSLQVQHEYHHQIMGTMMCDLVVWTFKGLVIVHLELDQNFIDNHFRPALLKKQLYKDSHMFLSVQELY